jgi:Lrp/AsnC family transcriptional regulator, leucine-responsive regulatory protein
MRAQTDLDSFDRKILDCLQTDARAPLHKIGEAVHLSTAAVQRRVKRLEGAGVIDAVVAVLDPAKLGRRTTIIVEVTLESERNDRLDIIRRKFLACPQVQQCYYVTGDSDFVLTSRSARWRNMTISPSFSFTTTTISASSAPSSR